MQPLLSTIRFCPSCGGKCMWSIRKFGEFPVILKLPLQEGFPGVPRMVTHEMRTVEFAAPPAPSAPGSGEHPAPAALSTMTVTSFPPLQASVMHWLPEPLSMDLSGRNTERLLSQGVDVPGGIRIVEPTVAPIAVTAFATSALFGLRA